MRGLSLVAASGGRSSSRCAGPLTVAASLVAEHRLQTRGLSSCGSRAQSLRGMWDLPGPGLEPVSPALAGRFSTTAPPGKPHPIFYLVNQASVSVFSSVKWRWWCWYDYLQRRCWGLSDLVHVKNLGCAWQMVGIQNMRLTISVFCGSQITGWPLYFRRCVLDWFYILRYWSCIVWLSVKDSKSWVRPDRSGSSDSYQPCDLGQVPHLSEPQFSYL